MKTSESPLNLRTAASIVALFVTVAAGSAADAARGRPRLTVQAISSALNIRAKLPPGTALDSNRRWQLLEDSDQRTAIPLELVPASEPDGTLSKSTLAVVASIPPGAASQNRRTFRMVESESGSSAARSAFRFAENSEKSLGLWEGDRPVFVYNHGVISKAGVPSDRNRSTYLHPIYGLDGEVLTDDFPKDHYHHRGLFWAWPHVRIDGKEYSLWDIRGIHQRFERWINRQAGPVAASLAVENGWFVGERKVMQERAWFTVYPATADSQAVDIEFVWIPTEKAVTLSGAEDKSYGGLTLRFAPRTETVITTPLGNKPDDLAMTPLPWADFSAQFADALRPSGAAIFISPEHPDFPPTWLTRHYGVLCVGWPGVKGATLQPGEIVRAKYRLWIHRESANGDRTKLAWEAYQVAHLVEWSESGR